MHDGTISLDGPAGDIVSILEVDDDDFGLSSFVLLFSDADIVI
jgi:hypothetical protein